MRRRVDFREDSTGGGEFLAFMLVAALSAGAFVVVGSDRPAPKARVVSMEDALQDRTATVSAVDAVQPRPSTVPLPSPRPQTSGRTAPRP
jgi:hypothetical protein